MKKVLFVMLLALAAGAFGKNPKETNNPIIGRWKYYTQSPVNDFQHVLNSVSSNNYQSEYFVFEPGNSFRHEFIDGVGNVVKTLHGSWKQAGDKVKITYDGIEYSLTVNYFFLDKDLVLGQNFNHVIFSKDYDRNIALKE